jgi:hypothetical protein
MIMKRGVRKYLADRSPRHSGDGQPPGRWMTPQPGDLPTEWGPLGKGVPPSKAGHTVDPVAPSQPSRPTLESVRGDCVLQLHCRGLRSARYLRTPLFIIMWVCDSEERNQVYLFCICCHPGAAGHGPADSESERMMMTSITRPSGLHRGSYQCGCRPGRGGAVFCVERRRGRLETVFGGWRGSHRVRPEIVLDIGSLVKGLISLRCLNTEHSTLSLASLSSSIRATLGERCRV